MPFIQCDLEIGLTDQEKRDLVQRMTEVTHRPLVPRTAISMWSCESTQAAIWAKPARPVEV
jgi:hypothetical protein